MQIRFREIAPGVYPARISDIKAESGPYGPYLRFTFTVTEGELQGSSFQGIVKPDPFKHTKFFRWISIILARDPPPDFALPDLIGKDCNIRLEPKIKNCKTFYSVTDLA